MNKIDPTESYHDVRLGLTALQAEYLRQVLDAKADSIAEELGGREDEELEEAIQYLEVIVAKLDRAIEEGRKQRCSGS